MDLYEGFVSGGSSRYVFDRQDIDISAHIPATAGMAAFVLISIDKYGRLIQTKGTEIAIADLDFPDIPATPEDTIFESGAVRVYEGQTEVREGMVNTDFVDLRFPGISAGGGGGTWGSITGDLIDQTDLWAAIQAIGSGANAFNIEGLMVVTPFATSELFITGDTQIPVWYIYLRNPGTSGSTIVDIHKNGVTIFTDQANRPTLAWNDVNGWAASGTPDFIAFVEGDILSLHIDEIAPEAADLVVAPKIVHQPESTKRDYILVRDEKASGTDGGNFASGAWRTRDINTIVSDSGGHCSIGSNQITLEAGTYECEILCPGYYVNYHKARLYNISDSIVELVGTSQLTYQDGSIVTTSRIVGKFTIASTKTFEVQHRCAATYSAGFGVGCNFGDVEIFTVAEFWKVA